MMRSVRRSRCPDLLRALAIAVALLASGSLSAAEIEVSGRVLDGEGKPAPRVPVELLAERVSEPLARGTTDAAGRFALAAPDAGMVRIVVRGAGFLPMEARIFPLLAPAELPVLRLIPDRPLRIRVLGTDGPLRGVRVGARALRRGTPKGWEVAPRLAVSDEDGALSLPRAKGEPLELTTIGSDFIDIRPAEDRAMEIRRAGNCTRTLAVRGRDRASVAGASVFIGPWLVGTTGEDGRMTIGVPCRGELRLAIAAADGDGAEARVQPSAPSAAAVPPVEVVLEAPARAGGRVLDGETREPIAGAFVWYEDDAASFTRTDGKGAYAQSRRAGSPAAPLRAAAAGHLSSASGPVFALQPTATLAGYVVDDEGRAVAGARVRAEEHAAETTRYGMRRDGLALRATSKANGAFRIDVLPRRTYAVKAVYEGYAPASVVAGKLAPAAAKSDLRVVLSRGQSAAGRILEKDTAEPVAGASLRLVLASRAAVPAWARNDDEDEEGAEFAAVSEADGRYRFEHLPPGSYELAVEAEGYAPQRLHGLTVDAAQTAAFGTVSLERGALVEGVVVDGDDRPVAGAIVLVHPPSAAGARGDAAVRLAARGEGSRQAVSGSDGRFLVTGLTPGATADVTVRREGYAAQTLARIDVPPWEPLRIVLEPSARVSGRVVDERGDAVPGAVVTVRAADAVLPVGMDGRLVDADASGAFELHDLAAGRLALAAMARGYLTSEAVLLDLAARSSIDDVQLTVRRGASIEGRVVTPSGQPAMAARVSLRGPLRPDQMLEREVAGFAQTDGEGRYRLEGVSPGPQTIAASQDGYQSALREVTVQPGPNQFDLRLGEGFSVGGRVTDAGGAPLAGVAVSLMTATPGARDEMSAADGAFLFTGVAPGPVVVSARKQGYSSARRELQLADRSVGDVELQLRHGGGAITGQILGLAAQDLPQLRITARKVPLAGMDGLRDGRADAQFAYRVEGVFAGDWNVTAHLPSGRQAQRKVTVAEGAEGAQADLEFARGVTLSGHVYRNGQPASDASVQATGSGGASGGSSATDANGAFRIEGLQPETHAVVVTVPRAGLRHERMVELASDQDIDIELPTARASGQAVDAATGEPLAGVTVVAEHQGAAGGFPPRATTDAAGAFVITSLSRGQYRFSASKEGYARAEVAIDIPADDSAVTDIHLLLSR